MSATFEQGGHPERMPLPAVDEMTPAQRDAAAQLTAGPRGGVKGPFIPLLRSPELLEKIQHVGTYLRFGTALDRRLNEFAVLIVSRHVTNQFEWAVHHPAALKAGLKPEIASALAEGRRPEGMVEEEQVVYDFCTELLATHSVSDSTYRRTVDRFGEQLLVELVAIVGYFALVSWLMNVARTPPPGDTTVPRLLNFPL
jgi:4-carboxymuconolactone decarboxylase